MVENKMQKNEEMKFPEFREFDESGLLFNGGNFLYMKGKEKWTCPVCKKYSLREPMENCICRYCGWEDDECDLNNPDVSINLNGVSYNQAKELWEKYHDDIHNHKDEFKLTFGVPELDEWIKENAGEITEDDLIKKVKEHFGENPEEQKNDG